MTSYGGLPILLAEAENWREMGRDFRVDHSKLDPALIFAGIVVLLLVIVFLWFLHRLMNRQEGRRLYNSPKQLFRSLCHLHELSRGERRLLSQIARLHQLPLPAGLFLEPDRFTAAMTAPALRSQRKQLQTLRRKLFADLDAPTSPQAEPVASA